MAREQKLYVIYNIAEYERSVQTGEEVCAVAVTYAKDRRGAMQTFKYGKHSGPYMLVWAGGNVVISL